jgi:hypothetical protein
MNASQARHESSLTYSRSAARHRRSTSHCSGHTGTLPRHTQTAQQGPLRRPRRHPSALSHEVRVQAASATTLVWAAQLSQTYVPERRCAPDRRVEGACALIRRRAALILVTSYACCAVLCDPLLLLEMLGVGIERRCGQAERNLTRSIQTSAARRDLHHRRQNELALP